MFSFLTGLLAANGYGRFGMMGWNQSSEAASSFPYYGYGQMMPFMMGWGAGSGFGGFGYYLSLAFGLITQVLLFAILVALLRWLWKKGRG